MAVEWPLVGSLGLAKSLPMASFTLERSIHAAAWVWKSLTEHRSGAAGETTLLASGVLNRETPAFEVLFNTNEVIQANGGADRRDVEGSAGDRR